MNCDDTTRASSDDQSDQPDGDSQNQPSVEDRTQREIESDDEFDRPDLFKSYEFVHDDGEIPDEEKCNEFFLPRRTKCSTKREEESESVEVRANVEDEDGDGIGEDDSAYLDLESQDEDVEYRYVKGQPRTIRVIPSVKAFTSMGKLRGWETDRRSGVRKDMGSSTSSKSSEQSSSPRETLTKFKVPGPFLQSPPNLFTPFQYGLDDTPDEMDPNKKFRSTRKPKIPATQSTKFRPCSFCRFWKFQPYSEHETHYEAYLENVTYRGHRERAGAPGKKSMRGSDESVDSTFGERELIEELIGAQKLKHPGNRGVSLPPRRPTAVPKTSPVPPRKPVPRSSSSLPRLAEPITEKVDDTSNGPRGGWPRTPWNAILYGRKIDPMRVLPVKPLYDNVRSKYMPLLPDWQKKLRHPEVLWNTPPLLRLHKKRMRKAPTPRRSYRHSGSRGSPRKIFSTLRGSKEPKNAVGPLRDTELHLERSPLTLRWPWDVRESPHKMLTVSRGELSQTAFLPPAEPAPKGQAQTSKTLENPVLAGTRVMGSSTVGHSLRNHDITAGPSGDLLQNDNLRIEHRSKLLTPPTERLVNATQLVSRSIPSRDPNAPLSPVAQRILEAAFVLARRNLAENQAPGRTFYHGLRTEPLSNKFPLISMSRSVTEERPNSATKESRLEPLVLPKIGGNLKNRQKYYTFAPKSILLLRQDQYPTRSFSPSNSELLDSSKGLLDNSFQQEPTKIKHVPLKASHVSFH